MGLVIGLLVAISVLIIILIRMVLNAPSKGNQRRVNRRKRKSLSRFLSASASVEQETVVRQEPQLSQSTDNSEPAHQKGEEYPEPKEALDSADAVLGLAPAGSSSSEPVAPAAAPSVTSVESPIITLMLFAPKDRPYGGYELLQALLSNGLRYGDQQIFHYYQSQQPDSGVLFSCASVVKPGTFDLPNMGGFSTPGLVLFFDAQTVKDPKHAFDQLLQTIDGMVDDLGGDVCDSHKRPFTKQSLLTVHRQLDQYLQNCRTPDLFATSEY